MFWIKRLNEWGVYKEKFVKGVYKILFGALLQNKSQKIMPEQTFYMEVLAEVVL